MSAREASKWSRDGRTGPRRSRLAACAMRVALAALCSGATAACGDAGTGPEVVAFRILPPAGLAVGSGGSAQFFGRLTFADGSTGRADGVTWSVGSPGIATIDASGKALAVSEGVTVVTARSGALHAEATLEVYHSRDPGAYAPGVSYFGRNGYVEYIPGELPLILSAPHGGSLLPSEMDSRSEGVFSSDLSTIELTLAVRDALVDLTGFAPHVVLSRVHRSRLDPNRPADEGAEGDPFATQAWQEYHAYIDQARRTIHMSGEGMYLDMHGHGHPIDRIELGYLLSAEVLEYPDWALNSLAVVQATSIREIGRDSPLDFSALLRGPTSLGGILEAEGVAVVPSPGDPRPGTDPYFSGGYSTRRHGSIMDTELVSGIQIEHHYRDIRDSDANRRAYAARFARAIRAFMLEHIGRFEPQ